MARPRRSVQVPIEVSTIVEPVQVAPVDTCAMCPAPAVERVVCEYRGEVLSVQACRCCARRTPDDYEGAAALYGAVQTAWLRGTS